MSRIDGIQVSLFVYDEFEGHRTVVIPVSVEDAEFVAAVKTRWQAYMDKMKAEAMATASNPFDLLG